MVHETLHKDIRGYIDDKTLFKDNIFVKGWAFHLNKGVCEVRAKYDNTIIKSEIIPKKGAADYYNNIKLILCGWKFKIPKSVQFCDIQMNIDEEWHTFFTLNKLNDLKQDIIVVDDAVKGTVSEKQQNEKQQTSKENNQHIFIIKDDIFDNPDNVCDEILKNYAISNDVNDYVKSSIEKLVGKKIHNMSQSIKVVTSLSDNYLNCNINKYSAIVFLTKKCKLVSGLSFYVSNRSDSEIVRNKDEQSIIFTHGNKDFTHFEKTDKIYTKYNRLVIFNKGLVHAFTKSFGNSINNGLICCVYNFDIEGEKV